MDLNYCTNCGNRVLKTIRICPACGERSFSPTPPVHGTSTLTSAQSMPGQAPTGTIGPQTTKKNLSVTPGVRGWLLFLCVSLTILTPLFTIATMTSEWRLTKPYFENLPNLKNGVMLEIACYTAVTFFSFYAGTRLWSIRPNAVRTAKIYLVVQMLVGLIVPGAVAAVVSAPGAASEVIRTAFHGILYFAIWYPYLCKSERVKATYI